LGGAATLVQPEVATKLPVDDGPVVLIASTECTHGTGFAGFCKADVNPLSVNCMGGQGCPLGMSCCYFS
jgi:hypothetical protein